MKCKALSTVVCLVMGFGLLIGTARADDDDDDDDNEIRTRTVVCPSDSVQQAVDAVKRSTTIFIKGVCVEDIVITKDDITLSGNKTGNSCNKADPSISAAATIDGTITIDGVRADIEFLTITGRGPGMDIGNRSDARVTCSNISNNEAYGVAVFRASNAVLRDNTLSGNGTRATDPSIYFDCGLAVFDASAVRSDGNTYTDNQYCAVSAYRHSTFRNGNFLPRESGNPADPSQRDVITERGCDAATGDGCFTTDYGPVAIEAFTDGIIDVKNAEISGEIRPSVQSSFRVDGNSVVQGNIVNDFDSMVRIINRFPRFGDRSVSYTGTLICRDQSQVYASSVQCGQTCSGLDGSGNLICAP